MTTEQIYTLVNEVNSQAFGEHALTVVDTSSLISLGNTVLSSSTNTEAFLNTLAQRIGRTILRFRDYRNKLGDMVINDFEYGAILQKIKVQMPEAEEDEMYDLIDGQSIDQWKVAKPDVVQKLFVTRTPYQFHITIQKATLKEAFLGSNEMGAFISVIFGEVRNAIEVSLENLGRITLATAIAETHNTAREINLVSNYNNATGSTLTAADALFDKDFLAYAAGQLNHYQDLMQDMSALYNDGTVKTFTPAGDLKVRINSRFERALETVVQYAAFNKSLVDVNNKTVINFWQAEQNPRDVIIKRPSDDTQVTANNVVAILHDKDALGVYKIEEDVATTGINAGGLYYNTYWHEKQLRFIDKSENIVIFTLN